MPVPVEQDVVKVTTGTYGAVDGAFAPYLSPMQAVNWHSCRETFHRSLSKSKSQCWLYHSPRINKCIDFITAVEKKLNLSEEDHCKLRPTTHKNTVCVVPGPWWTAQSMRLSLLTILLRVGRQYDGDFQSALFSQVYTTSTKPAIDRFMDGHTHFIGKGSMWQDTFSNYNRKPKLNYAETVLVKEVDTKVSEKSLGEARLLLGTRAAQNKVMLVARALDKAFEEGLNSKPHPQV